jgi:hypothetical protein
LRPIWAREALLFLAFEHLFEIRRRSLVGAFGMAPTTETALDSDGTGRTSEKRNKKITQALAYCT